jgi:hypothetical protein
MYDKRPAFIIGDLDVKLEWKVKTLNGTIDELIADTLAL